MGNSQGKPVEFDGEGNVLPAITMLLLRSADLDESLVSRVEPHSTTKRSLIIGTPTAVNLNHFRLLRVVGRGAFGKVRIVERKDTNLSFALKYIRKDEGAQSLEQNLQIPPVSCVLYLDFLSH